MIQMPLSDVVTDDDQTDDESGNENHSDQISTKCLSSSLAIWTKPRSGNQGHVYFKKPTKKRKRKKKRKEKSAKKTKIDRARERARKFPNNIEKLKKFFGTTSEGKLIEQESFKYFWDKTHQDEDEFDADDMDDEVNKYVEEWLQTFLDWQTIPYNHKQVCTFFDCIVTDQKFIRSITLQFKGKKGEEYDNYIQWSPFSQFQRRIIEFWNEILHKKGRLVSYSFQSEGETIVEGEIRIMNDDYDAFVRDINTIELMEQKIGKSKVTEILEQNEIKFESYAGYVKKMRAFQCMLQVGDNVKIAKYDDILLSNKFRTKFKTKLRKIVGVNSLQMESKENENTVYNDKKHGYNIEEYIKEMDERQNYKETRWIVKKIDGDNVTIESNGEFEKTVVDMHFLRPFDLNTLNKILNRDKIEMAMKRLLHENDQEGARMIWKHVTDKTPLEIEKEEKLSYNNPNIKKEKGGDACIYCRYCGARDLGKNREFNQVFRKIEYGQKKVWFCNTHGVQLMNYFNHRTEIKPKPLQCFADDCQQEVVSPEENTEFEFIAKKKKEKIIQHIEGVFLKINKLQQIDTNLVVELFEKYKKK